jgi:hypothetical protein
MVLCHSRMLYVEFTLAETMEHFLACHQNAFTCFGSVPRRVMYDYVPGHIIVLMLPDWLCGCRFLNRVRPWMGSIQPAT